MKLEDQVVSLELAKKLKELGFEQHTHFYWDDLVTNGLIVSEFNLAFIDGKLINDDRYYPAYTVAELGEMLPKIIKVEKRKLFIDYSWQDESEMWQVGYFIVPVIDSRFYPYNEIAETEVDARAKMLIYLKESNLL